MRQIWRLQGSILFCHGDHYFKCRKSGKNGFEATVKIESRGKKTKSRPSFFGDVWLKFENGESVRGISRGTYQGTKWTSPTTVEYVTSDKPFKGATFYEPSVKYWSSYGRLRSRLIQADIISQSLSSKGSLYSVRVPKPWESGITGNFFFLQIDHSKRNFIWLHYIKTSKFDDPYETTGILIEEPSVSSRCVRAKLKK